MLVKTVILFIRTIRFKEEKGEKKWDDQEKLATQKRDRMLSFYAVQLTIHLGERERLVLLIIFSDL